jgi:hypothetical protein
MTSTYGRKHRLERKRWEPIVAAGDAVCARCLRPISPGGRWHLSHDHFAADGSYEGIAHASCNIAERNQRVVPKLARQKARKKAVPEWKAALLGESEAGWKGPTGPNGEHWSREWYDWREGA